MTSSHYTKCRTKVKDKASLIKALEDMGFVNKMQVHEAAQQLEGYKGDKRSQTAEIIIPRRHVGGAANDIGFKLQNDGTWEAIISEYDRNNSAASSKSQFSKGTGGYNDKWLQRLTQRYAYHKVKSELDDNHFFIESETEENGELILECTRSF